MPARQCSRVDLPEPLGPSQQGPRALHGQTGAAKRRRLSEGEHEVACLDDHAAIWTAEELFVPSRRHLLGECRESRFGEVDPAQIGLQVEEPMVGEERVDEVALLFEVGELAHPPEVRGPLRVEVTPPLGDRA